MSAQAVVLLTAVAAPALFANAAFGGGNPYASAVVQFDPGTSPPPGANNPLSALGSPERFTGEGIFPSVVSPFNPAFGADELVSIAPGGHIVLAFSQPITDDANNLFGIDLIVFGNAGFIDIDWPNAIVSGAFGADGGMIEVSADGTNWHVIAGATADSLMPTIGFLDSGPYDVMPGSMPTDFTRPIDPLLTQAHMDGRNHAGVLDAYHGSGGGAGIDIASTPLDAVSFVRISNPSAATENIEIDAVADAGPRKPGDVDLDGATNVTDLLAVISAWGARIPGSAATDFNNDGLVGVTDLLAVIAGWGG